jgi:hypothetical protein
MMASTAHNNPTQSRKIAPNAPLPLFERIAVEGLARISSVSFHREQNQEAPIEKVASSI